MKRTVPLKWEGRIVGDAIIDDDREDDITVTLTHVHDEELMKFLFMLSPPVELHPYQQSLIFKEHKHGNQ